MKENKILVTRERLDKDLDKQAVLRLDANAKSVSIDKPKKGFRKIDVYLENDLVVIEPKCRLLWKVDEVHAIDVDEEEIEVKKDNGGYSFPVQEERCTVSVHYRFRFLFLILFIAALLAAACMLFVFSNKQSGDVPSPFGNVAVGRKRESVEEEMSKDIPTITFAGYRTFTVSKEKPNIEVHNPENNFVSMVFSVEDKTTGDLIARSGKVYPGEYGYINVMDYYKDYTGEKELVINISTFDDSGKSMNSIKESMKLIIEKAADAFS